MSHKHPAPGILLLILSACGPKGDADRTATRSSSSDSVATSSDSVPASRSASMQLKAMPMLPIVRAHLDSITSNPAMMDRSMSGHQAEVKHLVAAIHSDMTRLGMHSDPAYEALADSVVKGSARLGTAGGAEFDRLVVQHVDQVRRLAAIYEQKVSAMQ